MFGSMTFQNLLYVALAVSGLFGCFVMYRRSQSDGNGFDLLGEIENRNEMEDARSGGSGMLDGDATPLTLRRSSSNEYDDEEDNDDEFWGDDDGWGDDDDSKNTTSIEMTRISESINSALQTSIPVREDSPPPTTKARKRNVSGGGGEDSSNSTDSSTKNVEKKSSSTSRRSNKKVVKKKEKKSKAGIFAEFGITAQPKFEKKKNTPKVVKSSPRTSSRLVLDEDDDIEIGDSWGGLDDDLSDDLEEV